MFCLMNSILFPFSRSLNVPHVSEHIRSNHSQEACAGACMLLFNRLGDVISLSHSRAKPCLASALGLFCLCVCVDELGARLRLLLVKVLTIDRKSRKGEPWPKFDLFSSMNCFPTDPNSAAHLISLTSIVDTSR